jgi:hypothetical protein
MNDRLFGPRPGRTPGRTTEIKAWTTEALGLTDDVAVMVAELRCTEPGCPPFETVVAVMDGNGPTRQYKIHKPLADVTREDVLAISAHPGSRDGRSPHSDPEHP